MDWLGEEQSRRECSESEPQLELFSWRMFPFAEMRKTIVRAGLEESLRMQSRPTKFEIPMRHPRRDVLWESWTYIPYTQRVLDWTWMFGSSQPMSGQYVSLYVHSFCLRVSAGYICLWCQAPKALMRVSARQQCPVNSQVYSQGCGGGHFRETIETKERRNAGIELQGPLALESR